MGMEAAEQNGPPDARCQGKPSFKGFNAHNNTQGIDTRSNIRVDWPNNERTEKGDLHTLKSRGHTLCLNQSLFGTSAQQLQAPPCKCNHFSLTIIHILFVRFNALVGD